MPNLDTIRREVRNVHDDVVRKYIHLLSELTGRNTIVYYSAFLTKQNALETSISDLDTNAFMEALYELDVKKGLDLVLHTPGGDIAAAESLRNYLVNKFGTDIRVIVPQLAMSAGTMLACTAKTIVMGKHSSLGPVDPQIIHQKNQLSAFEVIHEFERAHLDIKADTTKAYVWQPILQKYDLGFISSCEQAMGWSRELVTCWLNENMLSEKPKKNAEEIAEKLTDKKMLFAHNRHIDVSAIERMGFNILRLETCQKLQERVLSVHHAVMMLLEDTSTCKVILNQRGLGLFIHFKP